MMTFGLFGKHVFSFGLLLAVALTALPAPGGSAQRVEAAGMPTVIAANNQSDTIIVTVRAGDTLSSIARRYNTTVYTLVQLNQIPESEPDLCRPAVARAGAGRQYAEQSCSH